MNRLYNLYKNPIFIFGIITLVLTVFLAIEVGFHFPDYYINREFANQLANSVSKDEVNQTIKSLINPNYKIYNMLFHLWGWALTVFSYTIIFRINNFLDFKNLKFLNKKLFVYTWINVSYIIFSIFYTISFMTNIMMYVYHWSADSFSIPLFTIFFAFVFGAIIYYPLVNILFYIVYNTRINRLFYKIILVLGFVFILLLIFSNITYKFTYINLILNFYYLMWLIFIAYSIWYMKTKNVQLKV